MSKNCQLKFIPGFCRLNGTTTENVKLDAYFRIDDAARFRLEANPVPVNSSPGEVAREICRRGGVRNDYVDPDGTINPAETWTALDTGDVVLINYMQNGRFHDPLPEVPAVQLFDVNCGGLLQIEHFPNGYPGNPAPGVPGVKNFDPETGRLTSFAFVEYFGEFNPGYSDPEPGIPAWQEINEAGKVICAKSWDRRIPDPLSLKSGREFSQAELDALNRKGSAPVFDGPSR